MRYDIVPGRPPQFGEQLISGTQRSEPAGEAALRRYVLTRALGSSILSAIQWTGITLLVLGVLSWSGGLHLLGALFLLAGLVVLAARALLAGVARRVSGAAQLGAARPEVDALVGQTRKGLRQELRRVGLPASPWGPLIILIRLGRGRSRVRTVSLLSTVELTRAVPRERLDALYRQLRNAQRNA